MNVRLTGVYHGDLYSSAAHEEEDVSARGWSAKVLLLGSNLRLAK